MSKNANDNRLNLIESKMESLLIRMDRLYSAVHKVKVENPDNKLGRPSKYKKSVSDLAGTKYVILSDGSVARKLKVSKNGNCRYYNLVIKGKLVSYDVNMFKQYIQNSL